MARKLTVSDMLRPHAPIEWSLAQALFLSSLCSQDSLTSTNSSLTTSKRLSQYTAQDLEFGWSLTKDIFASILPLISAINSDSDSDSDSSAGGNGDDKLSLHFPCLSAASLAHYWGSEVAAEAVSILREELLQFRDKYFIPQNRRSTPTDKLRKSTTLTPSREYIYSLISNPSFQSSNKSGPVHYMHYMITRREKWMSLTNSHSIGRPEVFFFLVRALFAIRGVETDPEKRTGMVQMFNGNRNMKSVRTVPMDRDLEPVYRYCGYTPLGLTEPFLAGNFVDGFERIRLRRADAPLPLLFVLRDHRIFGVLLCCLGLLAWLLFGSV